MRLINNYDATDTTGKILNIFRNTENFANSICGHYQDVCSTV